MVSKKKYIYTIDDDCFAVGLYFRGQRIWQAAMEDLMAQGMRYANQALLSGSAGGVSAIYFTVTSSVDCFHRIPESSALLMLECFLTRDLSNFIVHTIRRQKEEALNFRAKKESEVSAVEKELTAEISVLEKQRDELEAQLKKVNISLNVAVGRLKQTREERDQFDEASNQMIFSLKAKYEDLHVDGNDPVALTPQLIVCLLSGYYFSVLLHSKS